MRHKKPPEKFLHKSCCEKTGVNAVILQEIKKKAAQNDNPGETAPRSLQAKMRAPSSG